MEDLMELQRQMIFTLQSELEDCRRILQNQKIQIKKAKDVFESMLIDNAEQIDVTFEIVKPC